MITFPDFCRSLKVTSETGEEAGRTRMCAICDPTLMEYSQDPLIGKFLLLILLGESHSLVTVSKTIRYPGHAQFFKFLKDFGLLSTNQYPNQPSINPREVIEYYLETNLPRGQPDIVLTRITIIGKKNSQKLKHIYQMIDLKDPNTGYSAMARTTSYPTSIIGQLIADGTISNRGVVYAEEVVPAKTLLEELKKRNIRFTFSEESIG